MMADPMYEELSAQQWRVWCVLRSGDVCSIDLLFRQARPTSRGAMAQRQKQQIVGGVIARINGILKENGCVTRVAPGAPRGTYQLR